jgi:hypothetical protein
MTDAAVWQAVLSVGLGLGLAAATGFRVFVPLLVLSVAARAGVVPLASGFEWLAGTPALVALATATLLEIGAYYVPWLDHVLDTLTMPAATVAGVVVSASVMVELPPFLRWALAVIAGGAAAGAVAASTTLVRLKSTAVTGGLGNSLVATLELLAALATAVLALAWPLAVLGLLALGVAVLGRAIRRRTPSAST